MSSRRQSSTPSSSSTTPTSKKKKQTPASSSSTSSLPQQDHVKVLQRRIAKRFPDTIDADGNDIYWGVVAQVDRMESGEFFYFIRYDDGDTEHVGWVELTRMMALYDEVGEKNQKTAVKVPATPTPATTKHPTSSSSSGSSAKKKSPSSSSSKTVPTPKKSPTPEIISPKAKKLRKELEDRFFADLALVPSKELSILAKFVPSSNSSSSFSSGSKKIRRFYRDLSGPRTPTKHALLNRVLCSVLLFWKMPDRVQDQYYSQGTLLSTMCPPLSRVFMSHGVNYNISSDFKGVNQFVSIAKDIYGLTYKQWEQKFFRDLGKTEFAYMANPRKRFYDVVSGEKTEAKKVILNLCLRAVLPQWKTRGMLETGLNSLQFSWNQEKVQFDLWNDFGDEDGVMTMLEGVEEDLAFSGLCLESTERGAESSAADAVATTASSAAGRGEREEVKQLKDKKKDRKDTTSGHDENKKDKKKKDSRKEKEKKDKKNKKESMKPSSSGSKKSSSRHEKEKEKEKRRISDDISTFTPNTTPKKRKSEHSPSITSTPTTRSTRRSTSRSTSPPHSTSSSSSSHSNKRKSPPPPTTPTSSTTTTPTAKKPKSHLPPPPHISALPTTKHSLLLTLLSNRFFSSLSTHPSAPLSCLAALVTSANGTPCRRFYLVLKGSKNEAKERVFKNVVECVLKDWRIKWGGECYNEEEMSGLRWLLKERFESRGVGFDLSCGTDCIKEEEVMGSVPRINVRSLVRDEMLRVMATKIKIEDDKEHLLWMLLFLFAVDVFRGGDEVKDYNVIMARLKWSDVSLTVDVVTKTRVLEIGYVEPRPGDNNDDEVQKDGAQQKEQKQLYPRLSMMRQENAKDPFCLVRLTETYISMIEQQQQQQQSSSQCCVNFFQNVIKSNNNSSNSTKEYKCDDPPISPTDITSHLKSLMRHCQLDVELLDFFLSNDHDDSNNSYCTKYYDRPHLIIPTADYCIAGGGGERVGHGGVGGMASPDGSIRFDVYATERIRSCPHFNIDEDKTHLLWFLCWSFKTKLYPKSWGMVAKLRTDQVKITTTTTKSITKKRLEISDENGIYSIQDEDPTDPYCIVKHCERYKRLQNKQALKFFTRPFESDKLWYSKEPIGKNGLKVFLRHLATMCGLPMDAYRRVQMANNDQQNDDEESNGRTRSSGGGGRRSIDSDRTTPSSSPTSTTGGLLTPGKFKTNNSNKSPEKLIIKANFSFNNDPVTLLSTLIWQFKTKFISRSWRDFLIIDYHRVKILENPKRVQLDLKNHHMRHQDTKRHNAMRYVKNAQPKNPLCVVKLTELYLSMTHPSAVKFFNNPIDNKVERKQLEDSGSPIRFNVQPLKRDRMRKFVTLLAKRCDFDYEDHKDVKKLDCVGGTPIVWEDEDERREDVAGPSFISLLGGRGSDDNGDENSDGGGGGNVQKEKETEGDENGGVGGHCHGGGVDDNGGSFIIPASKEATKKQNDVCNSVTKTDMIIDETCGNGAGSDDPVLTVVPNTNGTGTATIAAATDSVAPPVTTNEKKSTKGFRLLCV